PVARGVGAGGGAAPRRVGAARRTGAVAGARLPAPGARPARAGGERFLAAGGPGSGRGVGGLGGGAAPRGGGGAGPVAAAGGDARAGAGGRPLGRRRRGAGDTA